MLIWFAEYWFLALIAFVIGVATGWWIWGTVKARKPSRRPVLLADEPLVGSSSDVASEETTTVEPVVAGTVEPAPLIGAVGANDALPVADAPVVDPSTPSEVAPDPAPEPSLDWSVDADPEPVMVAAEPVEDAARPDIAPAVGAPDNLELIKGVGPALGAMLAGLGVTRFDQIAAWGEKEVAEVDKHLGSFKGRIERDNWIDQAGFLARGDTAAFEEKHGELGSEIKS